MVQAFLVRAVQALRAIRVAEGLDIFAAEHDARVHGPEVAMNVPEPHRALQLAEAEASAGYRHPEDGPGHVARHPQCPGQDPIHRPLGAAWARRARRHRIVDVVQGRDDVLEDKADDEHLGRAQAVERALDLRQVGLRLGDVRGWVLAHHQGYAGEHEAPGLQLERAQGRGQGARGVVQPAVAQDQAVHLQLPDLP